MRRRSSHAHTHTVRARSVVVIVIAKSAASSERQRGVVERVVRGPARSDNRIHRSNKFTRCRVGSSRKLNRVRPRSSEKYDIRQRVAEIKKKIVRKTFANFGTSRTSFVHVCVCIIRFSCSGHTHTHTEYTRKHVYTRTCRVRRQHTRCDEHVLGPLQRIHVPR